MSKEAKVTKISILEAYTMTQQDNHNILLDGKKASYWTVRILLGLSNGYMMVHSIILHISMLA